jgi:sec-independent protein translocase protein TatA
VNVFGIGLPEMALIMGLALLVFGPKKLPEIGRSLGKAIRGFQEASKEFESEFKKEAEQIEDAMKAPMAATLEPPEQPVLAAGTTPAVESEAKVNEAVAAELPVSGESAS